MKTILKILAVLKWLLTLFWPKPKSADDQIKLDQYKCYQKWEQQLRKLEDELQKKSNEARQAKDRYLHVFEHGGDTESALRNYRVCVERLTLAANAVKAHKAREPSRR